MRQPRNWRAAFIGVLALAVHLLLARDAAAEAGASEKAAAEALFEEAARLGASGDFAAACPKLEASNQLDPALGTLLRLGDCYDRTGRTASAWATFLEAAAMAARSNQAEREAAARERAEDLETRLARLEIRIDDPSRYPGLVVRLDDLDIPRQSWGTELPVDPGRRRLSVSAPGYESWSTRLDIEEGPSVRIAAVPELVREPAPATPAKEPRPTVPSAAPAVDRGATPGKAQRVVGFVTGGLGLAGMAASGVLALRANALNQQSLSHCLTSEPNACDIQGKELRDDARRYGTLATVSLATGGALLAGGVVLVLTAPSRREVASEAASVRVTASADRTGGGVRVFGVF